MLAAVALSVGLAAIASSARAEPLPEPGERLVGLARVWAKAKFFHPYLAYKDIDWDAALIAAIPKVEAATSVAEYSAAVQGMLAVLHDPVTRVLAAPASASPAAAAHPDDWLSTVAPGIVKARVGSMVPYDSDLLALLQKSRRLQGEAAKANVLILDLRMPRAPDAIMRFTFEQLEAAMPAIDDWPTQRVLEHRGYRAQGRGSRHRGRGAAETGGPPPRTDVRGQQDVRSRPRAWRAIRAQRQVVLRGEPRARFRDRRRLQLLQPRRAPHLRRLSVAPDVALVERELRAAVLRRHRRADLGLP
jgi:hypothetical protein